MVTAGVTVMLDEPTWFDKDGKKVATEDKGFGQKSQFQLTSPELVLFMDEVGNNMSQKNGGNVGGHKLLVDPMQQALM